MKTTNDSFRTDDTYIKVKGQWKYLYRAVDSSGNTIDFMFKYVNNIIEQDHRFIKKIIKPVLGFKSFKTAEKTIVGIEAMHMIRRGQDECSDSPALSSVEFINKLFGLTA